MGGDTSTDESYDTSSEGATSEEEDKQPKGSKAQCVSKPNHDVFQLAGEKQSALPLSKESNGTKRHLGGKGMVEQTIENCGIPPAHEVSGATQDMLGDDINRAPPTTENVSHLSKSTTLETGKIY